jgi:hypothetical protein
LSSLLLHLMQNSQGNCSVYSYLSLQLHNVLLLLSKLPEELMRVVDALYEETVRTVTPDNPLELFATRARSVSNYIQKNAIRTSTSCLKGFQKTYVEINGVWIDSRHS